MADHQEASVTLLTDPVSVSAARRYASTVLATWGLPDTDPMVDTVQLIVSELATNAVQHTHGHSPTFTLRLRLGRHEELRIGVSDSCSRWPQRLPVAMGHDSGRGLVIVRHLATESGGTLSVCPADDGGKTVWIGLSWPRA